MAVPKLRPPAARRLRVYAFDPDASLDLGSSRYSHAVISLPWDEPGDGPLKPGPVNDYVEVIDVDPTSQTFYPPINLDDREVLAQDGLTPSEGDPRFHQQMVFAVVMKTIKLFERALGRKVMWAPSWDDKRKTYAPTPKLRIYPHALREKNAYYSREKRALLFGYFNSTHRSAGASWIFTVLSHDIIVHETTHAILDGLHPRYAEPTSADSLAFHEAFADIAALFSHFQLYEAVYDFIDKKCGRLNESGLLSGLAQQFARGTTGRSALRDFIDEKEPSPDLLDGTTQPHERGAILVAAVFDAFLTIYSARTADLMRISGARLGKGEQLHPDMTARLAGEAVKSADHVLRMCIRALDYLPPVDVRFGEFLRAIITADTDLIPDDRMNYRLAFVEAFRRRGIFPDNCLSMSPSNLLWDEPMVEGAEEGEYLWTSDILQEGLDLIPHFNRATIARSAESNRRKVWYWLVSPELSVGPPKSTAQTEFRIFLSQARHAFAAITKYRNKDRDAALTFLTAKADYLLSLGLTPERLQATTIAVETAATHFDRWQRLVEAMMAEGTKIRLSKETDLAWERALGIFFQAQPKMGSIAGRDGSPSVEVHSVRTTRRAGPDGQDIRQLVIEVTQRRKGYFEETDQTQAELLQMTREYGDFAFRGGATLIIDLREGRLRYVISKRIDDDKRLADQRTFLTTPSEMTFTYRRGHSNEPFALLHRH
jgi:hypothetical protein